MLDFVAKKVYLWVILLHYFIQKKPAAEALRITVTMFSGKQHAEISLDASRIMILISKIENALAHRKSLKTKT